VSHRHWQMMGDISHRSLRSIGLESVCRSCRPTCGSTSICHTATHVALNSHHHAAQHQINPLTPALTRSQSKLCLWVPGAGLHGTCRTTLGLRGTPLAGRWAEQDTSGTGVDDITMKTPRDTWTILGVDQVVRAHDTAAVGMDRTMR